MPCSVPGVACSKPASTQTRQRTEAVAGDEERLPVVLWQQQLLHDLVEDAGVGVAVEEGLPEAPVDPAVHVLIVHKIGLRACCWLVRMLCSAK